MIAIRELQERIEGMYVEPYSEEGQEVIGDTYDGHVLEVWEDGELTSTKNGDLYRARGIHQVEPPFLPEGQVLFPFDVVDDGEEYDGLLRRESHKRMVVVDDELKEILAEYRDFVVNQEVIEEC